jgi:hypothetical protein
MTRGSIPSPIFVEIATSSLSHSVRVVQIGSRTRRSERAISLKARCSALDLLDHAPSPAARPAAPAVSGASSRRVRPKPRITSRRRPLLLVAAAQDPAMARSMESLLLWHSRQPQALIQFLDTCLNAGIGVWKFFFVYLGYTLQSVLAERTVVLAQRSKPFGALMLSG